MNYQLLMITDYHIIIEKMHLIINAITKLLYENFFKDY